MKDVFRSGDSSKKFKIAEGQWYRYAPSYVSPAYHLLEGFPFIQEPPRSEERFSRNAETDLVCRLLLEKKKLEIERRMRLAGPFLELRAAWITVTVSPV